MSKSISLLCALALGSFGFAAPSVTHAASAPVAEGSAPTQDPGDECDYDEEEMEVMPDTDPAVIKIFEVCKKGIYWYEAEDANGNRFKITEVRWGSVDKGVVDFGDGAGGRYCEWR